MHKSYIEAEIEKRWQKRPYQCVRMYSYIQLPSDMHINKSANKLDAVAVSLDLQSLQCGLSVINSDFKEIFWILVFLIGQKWPLINGKVSVW